MAYIQLENTPTVGELIKASPFAARLLMLLIAEMDTANGAILTQAMLAEKLDASESTIKRAVRLLRKKDIIDHLRLPTGNIYFVNASIAWKGKRAARYRTEVFYKPL